MLPLAMRARYQHLALHAAAWATLSRGTRPMRAASGLSSCGGGDTQAAVIPRAPVADTTIHGGARPRLCLLKTRTGDVV
jgi:hypothetical protein